MSTNGFMIPQSAADAITVQNIQEYRSYLQSELDQWHANPRDETNPTGYWLHPEDLAINYKLIAAMTLVIKYFGEE
jgi:hypothetical protein